MSIKDLVPKFNKRNNHGSIQRHRSVDPLRSFQDEINRLFDDFFSESRSGIERWHKDLDVFTPSVDMTETDKEVTVSAELPGMNEKDISVKMDDHAITIHGEKKIDSEHKQGKWTYREQGYGRFHRTIPLPVAVDGQKAKASFKRGVLRIKVPKRESSTQQRRHIAIECQST